MPVPPDDGGRVDPHAPLPPDLDPRGKRHARAAAKAAAASAGPPVAGSPHAPAAAPASGRGDVRAGLRLGLMTVLTLASVAVLLLSAYAWVTYRKLEADITRVDAVTGGNDIDGKDKNILIVGNDNRETASDAELAELSTDRTGGSLNTDTIMLIHVPSDGKQATVISFPRDSYVEVPGHGMNKINSAYPLGYNAAGGDLNAKLSGGARLLLQTVQNLTGLKVDHFAQVDLLGFYRISKAIGGVPVNLCQAQKEVNSGIDLKAGPQEIEGKQALAFVRQRYGLPGGDLDRIVRQQYFLSQAFRKLTSGGVLLNPTKLNDLMAAVVKSVQMDPDLRPLDLAKQMANLSADNIRKETIPNEPGSNEAGDVQIVDPDGVKTWVKEVIGSSGESETKPSEAGVVDVQNGAGVPGLAGRVAQKLQDAGFETQTGNASDQVSRTVIRYPSAKEGGAKAVAKLLPGAELVEDDNYANITVVLGSDQAGASNIVGGLGGFRPGRGVAAPALLTAAPADCVN